MINIKKFILGAFAIGMMASCTKDLSDLNVDPNNSPSANPAQVLSSAEALLLIPWMALLIKDQLYGHNTGHGAQVLQLEI